MHYLLSRKVISFAVLLSFIAQSVLIVPSASAQKATTRTTESLLPDAQSVSSLQVASSQEWSAPLNISGTPSKSESPSIAVDTNDVIHIVWSEGTSTGKSDIFYKYKDDLGWSEPVNVSNSPLIESVNPEVVVSTDGIAHIIWNDRDEPDIYQGDTEVFVSRCDPDGCTTPFSLSNLPGWKCGQYVGSPLVLASEFPHLGIDEDNQLLAEWRAWEFANEITMPYSIWPSSGTPPLPRTGCVPKEPNVPVHKVGGSRLVGGTPGNFDLVFDDLRSDNTPGVYHSHYSNSQWSTPSFLGSGRYPDIYLDSTNNEFHVTWCSSGALHYWHSAAISVETINGAICNGHAPVSKDAAGKVHIVWGEDQIYESIKLPGSEVWSEKTIVSPNGDNESPDMVADGTGRLHLVWQELRDGSLEIFYTTSFNYGCYGRAVSDLGQTVLDIVGEQNYCLNQFENFTFIENATSASVAFNEFADLAAEAKYEVDFATMIWDKDAGEIFLSGIQELHTKVGDNLTAYPEGMHIKIFLGLEHYAPIPDQRATVLNSMNALGIPQDDFDGKWKVEVAADRNSKTDFLYDRPNYHSHVKLLIIDGKEAIVSGYNLNDPNLAGIITDVGVRVSGPIVQDALMVFDQLWSHARGLTCISVSSCEYTVLPSEHASGVMLIEPLYSNPVNIFSLYRDATIKTADQAILEAISSATTNVNLLQNRYFENDPSGWPRSIPTIGDNGPFEYTQSIIDAAQNGVQIRMLLSGDVELLPNLQSVANLRRKILQLNNGSNIFANVAVRFTENTLHAKAFSVDDQLVVVGSQNFDFSAFGDDPTNIMDLAEYDLAIDSQSKAGEFNNKFNTLWDAANEVVVAELIQQVINQALPGSIVYIPSGTYQEELIVDKPLTLVGEEADTTIIQSSGNQPAIRITSSNVEISNLRISGSEAYGIEINNSLGSTQNIKINRVVFENNVQGGVLVQGTTGGSPISYFIENNTFIGGQAGITINMPTMQTDTSLIRNNIFSGQSVAPIRILSSNDSRVEYSFNLFDDCGSGSCTTNWRVGNLSAASTEHDNLFDQDPLFLSPNIGDYHLMEGSPAIDAGDPSLLHETYYDGDNDGAIQVDMGAFEYFDAPPTVVSVSRLSVSTAGVQGNDGSYTSPSSVSADGRYVAFSSSASNLVNGDTNAENDIFLRDRQTNTTRRVSVATSGTQGNNWSYVHAISADGRYIAFMSGASNLITGDTNASGDIFVHDTQTNTTTRVSVATNGTQGNGDVNDVGISADGRFIVFSSTSSNLVGADTNGVSDVFLRDTQNNTTTRVSVATNGTQGNGLSMIASISANGRYITFISEANNLVSGDTNGVSDVFLRDTQTNTTTRVSVATNGTQGNASISQYEPAISADGRYIVFSTAASTLVSGDTNGVVDAFLHDTQTSTTIRVSIAADGAQGNAISDDVSISADGRYIAFSSEASNLVPGDTNGMADVFLRDTQTNALISVTANGTQGNGDTYAPSITANGAYIAVESEASNFVSGDTNAVADVFLFRIDVPATNLAPNVNAGEDQVAVLNSPVTIQAAYTDADNPTNHSATIDWGDGNVENVTPSSTGSGSGTVSGQHTYTSVGNFNIEVCVSDPDGGTGCDLVVASVTSASVIQWNTFAGSSTANDAALDVFVDGNGNSYVIGHAWAPWGTPVRLHGGGVDSFVAKFDANGTRLWHTFLGGAGNDYGANILTDANGNIYVVGYSYQGWGTSPAGYHGSGTADVFVAKLATNGTLLWNVFLGQASDDVPGGLVADASGNIYVGGHSYGPWGSPVGLYQGGVDSFIAKLTPSGAVSWNTFVGGTGTDTGRDIAIDANNNIFMTGRSTSSWGMPIRLFQTNPDVYVSKVNSSGALQWNTFLGGAGNDVSNSISLDSTGNIYIGGFTNQSWGTPVHPYQGMQESFVAKLIPSGALSWNTFLGSSANDSGGYTATDQNGNVFVAGDSNQTWGNPARAFQGSSDVFVAGLDTSGTLFWNAFLGGVSSDEGYTITWRNGNLFVGGSSSSNWGQPVNAYANSDAFLAKLNSVSVPSTPTPTPTSTSTATATFTPTPTPTLTPTVSASDLIFADSFESGNLSAWTSSTTDGGDLSVSTAAAIVGTNGLQALIDDLNGIFLTDDSPSAEPRYRARFYIDPNSLSMTSGNAHYLLKSYMDTSTEVIRVELRFSSGAYQIRASFVNDGSTWTNTNWFTITDGQHFVEFDWQAATGSTASNGSLTLWIDGFEQVTLSGMDNDTRRIDRTRFGALSGVDTGTTGTFYLDAFESRRTTYIGAAGQNPTPTFTATNTSTPTKTNTPIPGTATFTPTRTNTPPATATYTPSLTATPSHTPQPPTSTPTSTTGGITYTVSKFDDTNDGACNADCSLREAIRAANASAGADTILIPAGTYTLSITGSDATAAKGDLDITESVTITGQGNPINTVVVAGAGLNDRVFEITAGTVSISNIGVQGGNQASASGGGIRSVNGFLTLSHVVINGNQTANSGGGIYVQGGSLTVIDSAIINNTAEYGGGLLGDSSAVTLTNVTVSGNSALQSGGGVRATAAGTIDLLNVTVTNNTADSNADSSGNGGGIFLSAGPTVTLKNSIVAGNFDASSSTKHPDCSGTIQSTGHNLIGSTAGCTVTANTGDLFGTSGNPINPLMDTLQNTGGNTMTHALLASSPAINTGDSSSCPATDQRGFSRDLACDIGAYEVIN